jgi:hypothetical protein
VLVENIPIEYQAIGNDYDDDLKLFIETKVSEKLQEFLLDNASGEMADSKNEKLEVVKVNLSYSL